MEPCNYVMNGLQHRCFLVNFARFSGIIISWNICKRLLVKDGNFSEFYYFFVVAFQDFRTAIFKTPPSGHLPVVVF